MKYALLIDNKLEKENICFESDVRLTVYFLRAFQRLNQIVNELEELKPEVLKKIEHMNFSRQDAVFPSQNSTDYPIPTRPASLRNQSNLNANAQKVLQRLHNLFLCINLLFESSLVRLVCSTF